MSVDDGAQRKWRITAMGNRIRKITALAGTFCAAAGLLSGCGGNHGVSAGNPQSVTVWHYYSGTLAQEFDELVDEFNNTVGHELGITVYSESKSSIDELTAQLKASAAKEVGAEEMPNIFHCYLDTMVSLEESVELVNFDEYLSEEEKAAYIPAYIEEGTFGEGKGWKLFPVAKSTEVLMLNKTDWDSFAAQTGTTVEELATWEGLTAVSERYYEWSGGKAFYGRDAFANYLLVGSAQLGKEIFKVTADGVTVQLDREIMRRLWDNFYVPYVKGYFTQVGRYRSDDIKLGEIVAQTCSTASAVYFPSEVTTKENISYPIDYLVLPPPNFAGTEPFMVQQGASMAVTRSTESEEYASVLFLKWFTEKEQNIRFNLGSGYLPVKKDALDIAFIERYCEENVVKPVIRETVEMALEQAKSSTLFTSEGFLQGEEARNVLNVTMLDKAVSDRKKVNGLVEKGVERTEALEEYLSDENFGAWYEETLQQLQGICAEGANSF